MSIAALEASVHKHLTYQALPIFSATSGVMLAIAVASAARGARFVTRAGAVGVAILGATIMVLTGSAVKWWGVILAFFLSASVLTKLCRRSIPQEVADDRHGRSLAQVLANGGPATCCVIGTILGVPNIWYLLFVSAIAAVNSDTWASEVGGRWGGFPRNIVTWDTMLPGQSGGVSAVGILAAFFGAVFIALVAIAFGGALSARAVLTVIVAGLAGCLVDSVLGATLQPVYKCTACGDRTERQLHCNRSAQLCAGLGWFNTHWVNFTCGCIGAFVGALLLIA